MHVETWRAAYRGLIADEVLDALDVDQRTDRWSVWISSSLAGKPTERRSGVSHRLLVAETGDVIVGWASFGAGRDVGSAQLGELAGLYVRPDFWSQHVGYALLTRVEDELISAGYDEAFLWVLDGNERAIRFYERNGWLADGGDKFGVAGGATGLHELRHLKPLG